MENKKFVVYLMAIICLTNVVALLFLPLLTKQMLSWICGSTLSLVNIWLMSLKIEKSLLMAEKKARLTAYKDFNIRYLVLIFVSVLAVKYLNLNIVIFGIGLLYGQIWILVLYLAGLSGDKKKQER
jgi:hypothetical protein